VQFVTSAGFEPLD